MLTRTAQRELLSATNLEHGQCLLHLSEKLQAAHEDVDETSEPKPQARLRLSSMVVQKGSKTTVCALASMLFKNHRCS